MSSSGTSVELPWVKMYKMYKMVVCIYLTQRTKTPSDDHLSTMRNMVLWDIPESHPALANPVPFYPLGDQRVPIINDKNK